ncbi:MAG: hypothetical protein ACOY31_06505 [Bacillota bacterium]
MAIMYCKCDDCKNRFEVKYLIFKPENNRCPVCGSSKIKEETAGNQGCGCGGSGDRPYRFT